MLFSDMKVGLKRYGFDDTDPLAMWLNAAKDDFQTAYDWPFLQVLITGISVGAGVSSLIMPSDFSRVIYIRDVTTPTLGRKLQFKSRRRFAEDIQDQTVQNTPSIYTILALNQVQLWPVPLMPMTYNIFYQALIPDMTVDANPPQRSDGTPIPSVCHYPIVERAASIALQAENEEERAKQAENEWQNSLVRLMGFFGEEQLDEVETVQDEQEYFGSVGSRWIR